ncbi:hypothetical protein ACTTAL_10830 [Rhodobacter capsulatus]|uniref:hypothetical protein n=1 Tax=Rhodobacter capsulatus TaxID=1061 RepID=UPI00103A6445|nr:hypothetical protein [Rhodobacter capsulatus]
MDRHTVSLLRLGPERYRPPEPTLGDALRLYLKEHLKADSPETDSRVTGLATRVVEAAIAAIGRDPLLTAITREEARAVRDHMLDRVKATGRGAGGKVSAATVSRELAILSAVVNFAKVEFGMPDTMPNPFSRLPVARVAKGQGQKASEKRDPLPPAVLTKTRARVLANAAPELALIWHMVEGTGCRLAEVGAPNIAVLDLRAVAVRFECQSNGLGMALVGRCPSAPPRSGRTDGRGDGCSRRS